MADERYRIIIIDDPPALSERSPEYERLVKEWHRNVYLPWRESQAGKSKKK